LKRGLEGGSGRVLPSFSIIVPARDEEGVIARCLEALLGLDYPEDRVEIIVVEGGSRDSTPKLCMEYASRDPRIRVLSQVGALGKPSALNQALGEARGEIIGVFDADSVPERDVLIRAASYFEDPSVKAVQGMPLPLNEDQNMLTRVSALERRAWFQALVRGRGMLGLFTPLTGSCQFIRRSTLYELGGWPEDSLAEDVEVALRLLEMGYGVRYAEDVRSWEETPKGLPALFRQRARWYRGYMEASIRYGRLMRKPSRRVIDAEVSLIGPYIMVLSLISHSTWLIGLTNFRVLPSTPILSVIAFLLTATTLTTTGLALTHMERPRRLRRLIWIPIIYTYWLIQACIASYALLQIILRRPRRWERTPKDGSTSRGLEQENDRI